MPVANFFKFLIATSSGGDDISLAASTFATLLYTTGWIDEGSTVRLDQDFVLDVAASSASVSNFELSSNPATGYARVTLGARTITEVDARDATEIDSTDVTFSSVSSSAGVAGGMAIFLELSAQDSSGGRVLATFYDFATPVTPNGGDINVAFSTGGWMEFLSSTSDAS